MSQVSAVILAAGKGTRMKSERPKVLHQVCGLAMVEWVIQACEEIGVNRPVLIVGHGAEQVREQVADRVFYAEQKEQLGTGHAVLQSRDLLRDFIGDVLVLCGDTPLISAETLKSLLENHLHNNSVATVLTAEVPDPTGYGRILRDELGQVKAIVEQKDATPDQLSINEVNTGIYCFNNQRLFSALEQIRPNNAQGEYYLTDVLEILRAEGEKISGLVMADHVEMLGVNDRIQLAEAQAIMQQRICRKLMVEGVSLIDPKATYVGAQVKIGPDTVIYPNVHIEGQTTIGSNCILGANCRIIDSTIGNQVEIQQSVLIEAEVGEECSIGPYAYLRPGTKLLGMNKIGDFVEIKKSVIGKGSKVPHLSYVGDSILGVDVNIGAGTITCNYDGKNKWTTIIGDRAFIGSNSNLVAPVEIGAGALIGAGSTITKDVPEKALGIARGKQKNIADYSEK